jgi:WD40 repeat protein/serine/threonine protein kinase
MDQGATDRNMLLAITALRTGLIDQAALVQGMNAWALNRSRPLGEILVERGVLRPDRRAWLDAMVDAQIDGPSDLLATIPTAPPSESALATRDDGAAQPAQTLSFAHEPVVKSSIEALPANPTLPVNGSSAPTLQLGPPACEPRPTQADPSTIEPRFRILRLHARGGLGEVYLAHDNELNREVALKEIQDRHADSPRSRARFLLEAEITGGLEHPGIVPVYSLSCHADGRPYYAMRFIRGESLSDAIERFHNSPAKYLDPGQSELEFRGMLRRFLYVCQAIAYAHSRGVLHRDIKPGNIMLGKYGESLVVDWGLAKSVALPDIVEISGEAKLNPTSNSGTADTMPGSAIGTPQFMSPEQAAGDLARLGPASDVYSLGATLYTILTGRAAFEVPDVGIVLRMVQRGEFPPPRYHERSIPPALEAICLKAMATRPEDRYPSASALAEDIEHWMVDEPVSAHRESLVHRLGRWSRRHRTWAQAIAATVIVVALVAIGSAIAINSERHKERVARQKAEVQRRRAQTLSAKQVLGSALERFRIGSSSRGMLRLAFGLDLLEQTAPPSRQQPDELELDDAFRVNLAAWHHSLARLDRILPHQDMVLTVAYRPDGKVVLTGGSSAVVGSSRGEARLWDAETGAPIGPPMAHPRQVRAVAYRPGSRLFVTAGDDGLVRFWEDGKPLGKAVDHGARVNALAFDRAGQTLATAGEHGVVKLWSVDTRKPIDIALDHPAAVRAVAFSPTADRLATGADDGQARIWNTTTGRQTVEPIAHDGPVQAVAFSPDGRRLLTGDDAGTARQTDVDTGRPAGPGPVQHAVGILDVKYSPDGTTFACGTEDNNAQIWLAETGEAYALPLEHRGAVAAVAFSPDGRRLLTGCQDNYARTWDLPPAPSGRALRRHKGAVRSIAFGPGGQSILTAGDDKTAQLVDTAGRVLLPPLFHPDKVLTAVLSPDGAHVVTACADGKVRVWASATGRIAAELPAQPEPVAALAFRPDGSAFVTGGQDGKARIWETTSGKPLGAPINHRWAIAAVAFRSDGALVLTAGGNTVRLWQAATGEAAAPPINHSGPVYAAAFRPDGRQIVTGGENNTVWVWETATGASVGKPMIHRASVVGVAFAPDGRTILSGAHDRVARLWSAGTSDPLGPALTHPGRVLCVAFSADGRFVASGDDLGYIRTWTVPDPIPGSPERIRLWVEAITGMWIDTRDNPDGVARIVELPGLRAVRDRLAALGGPPIP